MLLPLGSGLDKENSKNVEISLPPKGGMISGPSLDKD
jgi:hypothetical protein